MPLGSAFAPTETYMIAWDALLRIGRDVGLEHFCRVATYKASRRHVFRYDSAGGDSGAFADRHSRAEDSCASNPDIVLDGDRLGVFGAPLAVSRFGREGMRGRVELHIRTHQHTLADDHWSRNVSMVMQLYVKAINRIHLARHSETCNLVRYDFRCLP